MIRLRYSFLKYFKVPFDKGIEFQSLTLLKV